MLTAARSAFEGRGDVVSIDDADGPATLERIIVLGDPVIVAEELRGSAAAAAALTELAAADELGPEDEDDVATGEYEVPQYRRGDFDPSVIDALMALESGGDTIVFDDPAIEAQVVTFEDLRIMERLLEPYVDFTSLARL